MQTNKMERKGHQGTLELLSTQEPPRHLAARRRKEGASGDPGVQGSVSPISTLMAVPAGASLCLQDGQQPSLPTHWVPVALPPELGQPIQNHWSRRAQWDTRMDGEQCILGGGVLWARAVPIPQE